MAASGPTAMDIQAGGGYAQAVQADVANENDVERLVQAVLDLFSRIDILVNNAGISAGGSLDELRVDEWDHVLEVNLRGPFLTTRAVMPVMRGQRAGHIINISSVAGYSAYAGFGVYSSTKFAVEGLTEALYLELAPLGIHVTVVEPGFFRTDVLDTTKH